MQEAVEIEEVKIVESNDKQQFSRVLSCGLIGVNAYSVEIEVAISGGLPNFILVGLPDIAINESRERVKAAIKSSGNEFPYERITVNLAPADTKKAGPTYDLPIAIGILSNCGLINNNLEGLYIVVSLDFQEKLEELMVYSLM